MILLLGKESTYHNHSKILESVGNLRSIWISHSFLLYTAIVTNKTNKTKQQKSSDFSALLWHHGQVLLSCFLVEIKGLTIQLLMGFR